LRGRWPTIEQLGYPALVAGLLVTLSLLLFRATRPYFAESV